MLAPYLVQKCFCRREIGRGEPLGEALVDRPEERYCISGAPLIAHQPSEAGGGAEFQRQRALPARPVERLPKATLGLCRSTLGAPQQKALALEAQQLGRQPAFFGLLGSLDRLIELGKSLRDLAGTGRAVVRLAATA